MVGGFRTDFVGLGEGEEDRGGTVGTGCGSGGGGSFGGWAGFGTE